MKYGFLVLFVFILGSCSPERFQSQVVQEAGIPLISIPSTNIRNVVVGVCPSNMVLVEGNYCPNVEEKCLYYVDNKGNQIPAGDNPEQTGRCGEFQYPTKCLSNHKIHKRFCIDKYELSNIEGIVPTSWLSWDDAKNMCQDNGKRLCTSSEWEFSCEGGGESPQPYPYKDGYHRDFTICNTDNQAPPGMNIFQAKHHTDVMAIRLDAMLKPSGSMSQCVSPFGVYDQIGNLDEWVINETGVGYKSGLKGGHIWGVRSRCRPMTTAHNGTAPVSFAWYETSGRCCLTP